MLQNLFLYLKFFDLCETNKVLNGKIRIELRKNPVKNILHAKVDGNYDYEISDISLWIPQSKTLARN
jgi:hypothetical protein